MSTDCDRRCVYEDKDGSVNTEIVEPGQLIKYMCNIYISGAQVIEKMTMNSTLCA